MGAEDKRSGGNCGGALQFRRTSAGSVPVFFFHVKVTSITQGDSKHLETSRREIELQVARSITVDLIDTGYGITRKGLGSAPNSFYEVVRSRRDISVTVGREHSALDEKIGGSVCTVVQSIALYGKRIRALQTGITEAPLDRHGTSAGAAADCQKDTCHRRQNHEQTSGTFGGSKGIHKTLLSLLRMR